jgi:DNA-binding IclR family transcriptional regulator
MAEKEGMLQRGLGLLMVLSEHPDGIGLTEISREASLPVSTVHRLLAVMVPSGFVRADESTRRYSLGLTVFELGQRVAAARSLSEIALPMMRHISEVTGETTFLSVLQDTEIVYLERVDGSQRVRVGGAVGRRAPVYCTSMGKSLLAFQPPARRDDILDRVEFTRYRAKTIVDRVELVAELERVREQRYSMIDEEFEEGIRSIAAPVLDTHDVAVAAICIAVPVFRVPLRKLRGFAPLVLDAARELSLQLPLANSRAGSLTAVE